MAQQSREHSCSNNAPDIDDRYDLYDLPMHATEMDSREVASAIACLQCGLNCVVYRQCGVRARPGIRRRELRTLKDPANFSDLETNLLCSLL